VGRLQRLPSPDRPRPWQLLTGFPIQHQTGFFSDTDELKPSTTYYYKVTAVDTDGNETADSNVARGKTADAGPETAAPTGLVASASSSDAGTVHLQWAANSEPDLAGYYLYRAIGPTGAFTIVNTWRRTRGGLSESGAEHDRRFPCGNRALRNSECLDTAHPRERRTTFAAGHNRKLALTRRTCVH
jgi:hypothetical protein